MILIVVATAAALRLPWLTADPPTNPALGIIWHDEGAWTHNARNRALWQQWRTDEWNPVFIAPAFTGLEYAAFRAFGVGTWQARIVPVASGLLAVAVLMAGLAALAGRRAAIVGGVLLATNFVFIMWNRAALMESTMTAFIVAGWAAYAMAQRRPGIGLIAGIAAILAWFTKAAAIFFVAALGLEAGLVLALAWSATVRRLVPLQEPTALAVRAAAWTLGGLVAAAAVGFAAFVLPYWQEYQFYNWQIAVTRKPEYSIDALLVRASWLPIVHDYFTRMWLVLTTAALGLIVIVARWRASQPAERLLVLWLVLGLAELVVHDSGNERRYVMFIPALVALAALVLGGSRLIAWSGEAQRSESRWLALPFMLLMAYLVWGGLLRLVFLFEIRTSVRVSALLSVAAVTVVVWRWQTISTWLSRQRITVGGAAALTTLVVGTDLAQYWQWARQRTFENYEASIAIGRVLPPGTLVHGKLANGLSLENRIKPVFVGREFGNYSDRKTRDDVRYILTYVTPRVGYEGSVIQDVLDAYPNRAIIMTFDVAETATGRDRAALIDKFGGAGSSTNGQTTGRAKN
jgi:4-amino-4-deoxy-L-arabinose transferase-like glycosyltransferase